MTFRHTAIAAAVVAALNLAGVAIGANLGGHRQAPYTRIGAYTMPMMATYAATPAASTRQWHHFRGRVTSANQAHRWFWMRTLSAGHVQIYTNRNTYWGTATGGTWDRAIASMSAPIAATTTGSPPGCKGGTTGAG